MSIFNKKSKELITANFFTEWYNKKHGFDFIVINDQETKFPDVVLKSESDESNSIDVEITTIDVSYIKAIVEANRLKGKMIDFSHKSEETINQVIQDAKGTHYPKEVQQNTVLLIWSDTANFDSEYIKKQTRISCDETFFRGIYLIELPDNLGRETYPKREGKIIQLH